MKISVNDKMLSSMKVIEKQLQYIGKLHIYVIVERIREDISTFTINRRDIGSSELYMAYSILEKETLTWKWIGSPIMLEIVTFESIDDVLEEIGKWGDITDVHHQNELECFMLEELTKRISLDTAVSNSWKMETDNIEFNNKIFEFTTIRNFYNDGGITLTSNGKNYTVYIEEVSFWTNAKFTKVLRS